MREMDYWAEYDAIKNAHSYKEIGQRITCFTGIKRNKQTKKVKAGRSKRK